MGRPQPKSKPKRRNSKLPRRRSKPKRRRKTPTKKQKRQARSNSFDHGSARRSSLALPSYPRLLTFNFSPSNLAACPASSQSDSEAIPPRNHANGAEICFLAEIFTVAAVYDRRYSYSKISGHENVNRTFRAPLAMISSL